MTPGAVETLRGTLLASAIEKDPQHAWARWQSGQVRDGDRWVTVDDFERDFATSDIGSTYLKLRDRFSGSLPGEISLARWCRQKGFEDRGKLHWTNVLRFAPGNIEARKRLGVREFRGRLMTTEQIMQWKQSMETRQNALDRWDPVLVRWQREIESPDIDGRIVSAGSTSLVGLVEGLQRVV